METVEVVIRIPKEYKDYIEGGAGIIPDKIIQYLFNALDNGTVLPKGHGDLKDYDAIKSDYIRKMSVFMSEEERMDLLCTIVDEAPIIIEADRGDDNG